MTASRYLLTSFAVALVVACALIFGMGYYESPALAVEQFAFIVLPIFVPLALLATCRRGRMLGTVIVGAILAVGWGYMAYIDLTADARGGATFAIFMGWGASIAALIVAAVFAITTRFIRP